VSPAKTLRPLCETRMHIPMHGAAVSWNVQKVKILTSLEPSCAYRASHFAAREGGHPANARTSSGPGSTVAAQTTMAPTKSRSPMSNAAAPPTGEEHGCTVISSIEIEKGGMLAPHGPGSCCFVPYACVCAFASDSNCTPNCFEYSPTQTFVHPCVYYVVCTFMFEQAGGSMRKLTMEHELHELPLHGSVRLLILIWNEKYGFVVLAGTCSSL